MNMQLTQHTIPTRSAAMHLCDPAEEAWTAKVADLCSTFFAEIDPDAELPPGPVLFVLHSAAEFLWLESDGKPRWSKLDVGAFLEVLDDLPWHTDGLHEAAVHVLSVFYCWLADTGVIRHATARRKVQQLMRHCRTGGADMTGL